MNQRSMSFALLAFLLAACSSQASPVQSPTREARASEPAGAAGDREGVTIGARRVVQSAVLGETRPYLVHLPAGYEAGSARYPVIYLLDGDAHFHHVTGIVAFLATQLRMPPAIVIGISNTERRRDFTPTPVEQLANSGGGDRFLAFIETELMPQVERDYRTVPLRILVGHSLGGLLAVHALISRPDLFDAHIAASPSLQWDGALMLERIQPLLARPVSEFLYYTLGTEHEEITAANKRFAELLVERAPPSFQWTFDHMAAEDHGSVVHWTVYRGLETFFGDYRLTSVPASVAELRAQYERIGAKYKVDARPPENIVNNLGYAQLQATPPNIDAAIEFFELNVELYPDSANVYDSLGEAHERAGRLEDALANYEEALARSNPGEPLYEAFREHRDRAARALGR